MCEPTEKIKVWNNLIGNRRQKTQGTSFNLGARWEGLDLIVAISNEEWVSHALFIDCGEVNPLEPYHVGSNSSSSRKLVPQGCLSTLISDISFHLGLSETINSKASHNSLWAGHYQENGRVSGLWHSSQCSPRGTPPLRDGWDKPTFISSFQHIPHINDPFIHMIFVIHWINWHF